MPVDGGVVQEASHFHLQGKSFQEPVDCSDDDSALPFIFIRPTNANSLFRELPICDRPGQQYTFFIPEK